MPAKKNQQPTSAKKPSSSEKKPDPIQELRDQKLFPYKGLRLRYSVTLVSEDEVFLDLDNTVDFHHALEEEMRGQTPDNIRQLLHAQLLKVVEIRLMHLFAPPPPSDSAQTPHALPELPAASPDDVVDEVLDAETEDDA